MIAPLRLRGRNVEDAELLVAMETIRAIETVLLDDAVARRLEGPIHVSLGEEAVAVGIAAAMGEGDVLLSNHRGHGHALAFGLDPFKVLAEVVGDPRGYAGGRGGSMHIFDPGGGFLGTNGIVGGNAAVALGAALALQVEGKGRVAVVAVGDGAMATGIVYESLNLAVLWRLPLIFVCVNNGYAELTPTSVHLSTSPAVRAKAFGLVAEEVDGTQAMDVSRAIARAIEGARSHKPSFVEAKCFRFGGHYAGDAARYRPEGEDAQWRLNECPIRKLAQRLGITDGEQQRRAALMQQEAAEMLRAADA